jgi:orotidine-5'-phosphate decarboxylase
MTTPTQLPFADRLCQAVSRKGTPLIVGLDPRLPELPLSLQPGNASHSEQAAAYQQFCCEIIDVVADLVPAVKPQAAFFEQLGPWGMTALSQVVDYAREAGLLVIMDAKRGDIGSTAVAYAEAYLGEKPLSPWGCDALTVNPYLGQDTLQPFMEVSRQNSAGIFVLVKTSNPGSALYQDRLADGKTVYQVVADTVEDLAAQSQGRFGYGAAGAVVGATYPRQLAELREQMPHSLFLIPGYGAQGGKATDLAAGFDPRGLGAVVNSSRGIIFAFRNPRYQQGDAHLTGTGWLSAVERATRDSIAEIAADTPAGKLRETPSSTSSVSGD